MKIRLLSYFIILLSMFAVYESAAEDIGLLTDEFWNMMIESEQKENMLTKLKSTVTEKLSFVDLSAIRIEGRTIKKIIVNSDSLSDTDYISGNIERSGSDIIIVSPLLSGIVNRIAEKYPDIFFIVTNINNIESDIKNIAFFTPDYADAFSEAGKWAASQTFEVHALFFTGNERQKKAEESFMLGWNSIRASSDLHLTEFRKTDTADEEFITRFSDSIRGENKAAAVFAGPFNETVLSRFDGTSVILLSEYLRNWENSLYNLKGSVELPATAFLEEIVKSVKTGTYIKGGKVKAEFFLYES